MNSIVLIYMMLFSFIIIIITSLLYLMYVDAVNRRFLRRVGVVSKGYENIIMEGLSAVESGGTVSLEHINLINKRNKSQSYERVFQNVMIDYATNKENRGNVIAYMSCFESYVNHKIQTVRRNRSVKHVQNVFLVGEYRLRTEQVVEYLIEGVHSKSIALKFNSLSALSKIGDADFLVRALVITAKEKGYLNQKVLTDVLDSFEGDREDLIEKLVENIRELTGLFRRLVINYFLNQNEKSPAKMISQLLKEVTDKEEHIMILKYFGNIHYNEAIEDVLKATQHEIWEIRAISSKTLRIYVQELELQQLLPVLSDDNWYVRINMATTVLDYIDHHQKTLKHDFELIKQSLDDPYAIDALEYARHLQEEPSHLKESIGEILRKGVEYAH
ncbi:MULTISPECIES: HEAT repeat domain-containing protein [unclassified Fusibacter]|uniref:HEAT repeat domain-containing protein n=1 Tax=unclassified Fusibacter TaxID=2624464 RepID=UPI001012E8A4|nr:MULTISPECIES: hypothetical protein [unclassified Fusibacter]MCK8059602.1 hypothetical protein [Fusibacter sp. A2]NPE21403.1 hypothetical protein [Fusibacter sp. A1]RXV61818.1 hypothetical protein DWB64_06155 [Fusibacter sp. A1]